MDTPTTDHKAFIKQLPPAQRKELAAVMQVSATHLRNISQGHRELTEAGAVYLDALSDGAVPLNMTAPNMCRAIDKIMARRLRAMAAANDPSAHPQGAHSG